MLTFEVREDKAKKASFGILQILIKDDLLHFPFCLDFVAFNKMDLAMLIIDEEDCSFICFFS